MVGVLMGLERVSLIEWALAGTLVAPGAATVFVWATPRPAAVAQRVTVSLLRWSVLGVPACAAFSAVSRRIEDFGVAVGAAVLWAVLVFVGGLVRARRLGVPFGAPVPDGLPGPNDVAEVGSGSPLRLTRGETVLVALATVPWLASLAALVAGSTDLLVILCAFGVAATGVWAVPFYRRSTSRGARLLSLSLGAASVLVGGLVWVVAGR